MDGVGTPIIGRPRPLPRHDTPNPAYHPHTLNYEEPYHFALPELIEATHASGSGEAVNTLETLIDGQRLRDISDLPCDLAI